MRFAIAAAAFLSASLAAAQSSTTSAAGTKPTGGYSICAQDIVDVCVDGYKARIAACGGNDWVCLCDVYTDVNVCYDNCPGSNDRPPVQNQVKQFCAAAAPIKSSSLSVAATAIKTSTSSTATETTGTQTPTGASASVTPFNTGAAVAMAAPIGGAFAMVLGVAGML